MPMISHGLLHRVESENDATPQSVSIGKYSISHCLIDYQHPWPVVVIPLCEKSPFDQRDSHHAEVIRADGSDVEFSPFVGRRDRLPFDLERACVAASAQWQQVCRGCAFHSRQALDARKKLILK